MNPHVKRPKIKIPVPPNPFRRKLIDLTVSELQMVIHSVTTDALNSHDARQSLIRGDARFSSPNSPKTQHIRPFSPTPVEVPGLHTLRQASKTGKQKPIISPIKTISNGIRSAIKAYSKSANSTMPIQVSPSLGTQRQNLTRTLSPKSAKTSPMDLPLKTIYEGHTNEEASSPTKKNLKRKNKSPEPKIGHSVPADNKIHQAKVKPMKDDFKSVNNLEPVLEEPSPKKRRKNKKKVQKEGSVEVNKVTLQKTSPPKPEISTDSDKNRHDTSLETVAVVKQSSMLAKQTRSELSNKYTVLKDDELVKKFMAVTLTNNQKGRIRQVLKESFRGTNSDILPDVIHNKIQAILKSSANLNDTDLRKIRILYNMLKLAIEEQVKSTDTIDKVATAKKSKKIDDGAVERNVAPKKGKKIENGGPETAEKMEEAQKIKGPKRYVVFVGNLPLDINKEIILNHFSDLKTFIKDIRIPSPAENKKSAIAYVELSNQPTFEMALSKHHSMLGNKRINVLYTTQTNSKVTKTEAKGKTAKLVAMVKSGQLAGSVPLKNKRSQRRAKMRKAQKLAEANQ